MRVLSLLRMSEAEVVRLLYIYMYIHIPYIHIHINDAILNIDIII